MKKKGLSQIIIIILFIVIGVVFSLFLYKSILKEKTFTEKKNEELISLLSKKKEILLVVSNNNIGTVDDSINYFRYVQNLKNWLSENGIHYKVTTLDFDNPNIASLLKEKSNTIVYFSWTCSPVEREILEQYSELGGNIIMFRSCLLDDTGTTISIDQEWYSKLFGVTIEYANLPKKETVFYVDPIYAKKSEVNSVKLPPSLFNRAFMAKNNLARPIIYTNYQDNTYSYLALMNMGKNKNLYIDDKFLLMYESRNSEKVKEAYEKINTILLTLFSEILE